MKPPIHVFQNDKQEGPYTIAQVQALLSSGALTSDTLVWQKGMSDWAPLSTILSSISDSSLTSPTPGISSTPSAQTLPKVKPHGIGGWLLWYCVMLTVLSPLSFSGQMIQEWNNSEPFFTQVPGLKTAMTIEYSGIVLVLAFGFIVGSIVWSGSQSGRIFARRYILVRFSAFIVLHCIRLFLLRNVPTTEMWNAFFMISIKVVAIEAIFAAVWWSYFKKSKRVRNTYGPEPAVVSA